MSSRGTFPAPTLERVVAAICPHRRPQRRWRRADPVHDGCPECRLRAVGLFPQLRAQLRRGVLAAALAFVAVPLCAQRPYWTVPLDSLAVGHTAHTHVQVTGVVTLVAHEDDGDLHVRLTAPSGRFIVAECVPALPCRTAAGLPWIPALGDTVTVFGISRRDPEHAWWEVHPVEAIGP